jgi:hypothetical protein
MTLMILILLLLFVEVLSIPNSIQYDKLCSAIQDVTSKLNHANQTFIFRCRPGDDCGGVGDRLGGVMGGALFSIMSGKSYRVHWPGLTAIFKAGPTNWTYDVSDLGLSRGDEIELDATRVRVVHGGAFYRALPHVRSIAIMNDLNAWLIKNRTLWTEMKHYKTIFLHSNRGTNADVYKAVTNRYNLPRRTDGPNSEEYDYYDGYRCIFLSMFQPSDEFLHSSYVNINDNGLTHTFQDIINILDDPKLFSIAIHYRVDGKFYYLSFHTMSCSFLLCVDMRFVCNNDNILILYILIATMLSVATDYTTTTTTISTTTTFTTTTSTTTYCNDVNDNVISYPIA